MRSNNELLKPPPLHLADKLNRALQRRRTVINARYNMTVYIGREKQFPAILGFLAEKIKHACRFLYITFLCKYNEYLRT